MTDNIRLTGDARAVARPTHQHVPPGMQANAATTFPS